MPTIIIPAPIPPVYIGVLLFLLVALQIYVSYQAVREIQGAIRLGHPSTSNAYYTPRFRHPVTWLIAIFCHLPWLIFLHHLCQHLSRQPGLLNPGDYLSLGARYLMVSAFAVAALTDAWYRLAPHRALHIIVLVLYGVAATAQTMMGEYDLLILMAMGYLVFSVLHWLSLIGVVLFRNPHMLRVGGGDIHWSGFALLCLSQPADVWVMPIALLLGYSAVLSLRILLQPYYQAQFMPSTHGAEAPPPYSKDFPALTAISSSLGILYLGVFQPLYLPT